MEKLHFSIFIDAPVEKVWSTMLDDATYREWTKPFDPSSHYIGNWEEGSKMQFIAADGSGMLSTVVTNRPYEFLSIRHDGFLKDGVEDTTSEEVKKWGGAKEEYTFIPKDGGTEVKVEMDSVDEYKEMFEKSWPEALDKLKELAEE